MRLVETEDYPASKGWTMRMRMVDIEDYPASLKMTKKMMMVDTERCTVGTPNPL